MSGATTRTPQHEQHRRRLWPVALVLLVLLAAVLASLLLGARPVSPGTVWAALFDPTPGDGDQDVVQARLPRTLTALVVGAALGLAGTGIQGITRNPLGDPGILGVNAGAALGVVAGIRFLGVSTTGGQVWTALAGAAVAAVAVYAIAASGRSGAGPVTLAIAGAALAVALTGILNGILLTDRSTLDEFRHWQVGAVTGVDPAQVLAVAPFLLVGGVVLLASGQVFNRLALGDDTATALGLRVGRARLVTATAVVLVCATATALAGPIAFVGLLVPHAVRAVVGADYRWLTALSVPVGASLVLVADVLGRLVLPNAEVAAGVMTAVLGAPVLLVLVRRGRQVDL